MRTIGLALVVAVMCGLLVACGESSDNAPTPLPIPSTVSPTATPVGDQVGIEIDDVQVACQGEIAQVSLHAFTDVRLPDRTALFVSPGRGEEAYTPMTEPLKVEISMTDLESSRHLKRETLVEARLPQEVGGSTEKQFQLFLASLAPGQLLRSQTVLLDSAQAACS